jgi:hypothetical protein
MVSGTSGALHNQTGVDRDITRMRGEPSKVLPLADGIAISRLAHCHAIARTSGGRGSCALGACTMRCCQKAAIHISIRIGLQALPDRNLLILHRDDTFNTIFHRSSFLAKLCRCHGL